MLALREIEAAFSRALLGGDERLAVAEVPGDGLAPGARLQVYRRHVFTTLTAALRTSYPVVCRLVDERFFGYAADQYIRSHPPSGPCLFEYGATLPEFLADFAPCRHLRYLPDVARLEWALNAALHAEDVDPLDPAQLRGLSESELPTLMLRLDPSFAILSSRWPIDRIFRANQPDADPGIVVDLALGGVQLEVRRIGHDAVFRALDQPTYAFRRALAEGHRLEEAAAAALALDASFDLAPAFQALFAEQLPVDFVRSDPLRENC
ncbi:MAG: HvfC/BufC family peptide modification chaperone [Candidatus Rokuibacteriota bacterium]